MSAPVAAGVLRELGAKTRTFASVRAALLWYRDQLAARLRVNRDPASVGTPTSRELRDETAATFAAIAQCIRREHVTDPGDPDEAAGVRYRVSGEMLNWLVAWYEGDGWGDGTYIARQAGLSRETFARRCARTERVLRTRLEHAGVIA